MLKKIDRNCFLCYKKSFLSYSIFNLHWPNNSSGCCLFGGREPFYFSTSPIDLSSVFRHFFRSFFENFFVFVWPVFEWRLPLAATRISYHKLHLVVNCFCGAFLKFFQIFFIRGTSSCVPHVRFGQLGYLITNANGCQLFFGTFFRFFQTFFKVPRALPEGRLAQTARIYYHTL